GDDDPRLREQAQLQEERRPAAEHGRGERPALDELRDDDRYETRLAPWKRPRVVEDRVRWALHALEGLDRDTAAAEVPPPSARVTVPAANRDRPVVDARDLAGVPRRHLRRRVEALDVDDDRVRRLARTPDRRHPGAQAARHDPV